MHTDKIKKAWRKKFSPSEFSAAKIFSGEQQGNRSAQKNKICGRLRRAERRGTFVGKTAARTAPISEVNGEINIVGEEVHYGVGADDGRGEIKLPAVARRPIGISQRGIIGETAQRPFRARRTDAFGEATFKIVEQAFGELRRAGAREPDIGGEVIGVGGLRPVRTRRVGKGDGCPAPDHALRWDG